MLAWLSGDEGWRPPAPGEPSDREAYKEFSEKVRSVSEDVETGIVTVSFEFRDPELAAEWANAYVAMANADIRQDTVREASRALDYLNEQVQETSMAANGIGYFLDTGAVPGDLPARFPLAALPERIAPALGAEWRAQASVAAAQ